MCLGAILRRHPRTALGVTEDNVVYAAVVYGRQPTVTEGANITDMAKIMNSLSVKDAINLDGGGSSMMVADGKRPGNSSDGSERPVSDAIIFTR
ncbi:phosphodiester glycosidase family protein [Vibrio atlanticus]|nr:phosphodiester glycosidase family protein [Vibrio atlanticus]